MKKFILCAAVSLLGFVPAAQAEGVKIGVLTCDVEGGVGFIIGSSKDADCVFKSGRGRRVEHYQGRIGKLGVDIGVTGQTVMAWAVFAPGRTRPGALHGSYTGVSAEATVGVGLGANVLIGGFKDGINLQPISIQGQTGLNVAAGIGSLTLE